MTYNPKRDPPAPLMIAGHVFPLFDERCTCGMRLPDLTGTTRDDIGKPNIAHVGQLTGFEYDQIEAYRDRLLLATRS